MKKKKIWHLVSCIILLLCLTLIWTFNSLFKIRKVVIISVIDEFHGLSMLNNKNLLILDDINITSLLLSQNKIYSNLNLRKRFPNLLEIDTKYRIPVAFLINNNRTLYIDKDGVFIPNLNVDSDKYTKIEIPNLHILNMDNIDWRVLKAVKLVVAASKNFLSIANIRLDESPGIYHLFLAEGEEAEFSQEQDPYLIAASLQIIISRFRIEGKIIRQIKFQYDKPVVILKSGEKISSI